MNCNAVPGMKIVASSLLFMLYSLKWCPGNRDEKGIRCESVTASTTVIRHICVFRSRLLSRAALPWRGMGPLNLRRFEKAENTEPVSQETCHNIINVVFC